MQSQSKLCVCFIKLILSIYSGAPKLPLISKVSHSPNTKKLFLRLSAWDNELLSKPI